VRKFKAPERVLTDKPRRVAGKSEIVHQDKTIELVPSLRVLQNGIKRPYHADAA
jgi:hypothetical protein